MHDPSTPIATFLDATAARSPTPGGGAVTALTGALAAAIGEMVMNYSIGKKGLEAFEGELVPALASLHQHRLALTKAMVDDQASYAALTAARKLPESPERAAKIKAALKACIRAPQDMAAAAVGILEVCDRVINFVNPYLLSDLAVCADLAMATARCAIYNVRVNLADVKDPAERHQIEATIGQVLTRSAALIRQVAPRVWDRLQQTTG
ncbi:cyclodeaminase/cyclohydrolase family protein [Humisphaera borealis]|uniref:Cyclodeaminase/cyclohydrolase family protein n=1 Tax=Humisphaera borealis TaxID=2807512 RepID=A0A7M2WYF0_9BACT|nr:cyclodeaminase/cyclohydrolase family protein [Humisphaera borealis]QOV90537.1 cyclodeaminase/cyclohydrolase family protein [Humisphaera borealis]